ncbi:MAG: hypothetical protein KatS3mg105_3340 [Gemmatales bacterium]|nr:MAG: hypothetical protein KatS3mg105_3340 [Gemmatales bacterium]
MIRRSCQLSILGCVVASALFVTVWPSSTGAEQNQSVSFARSIAPIFRERCLRCHGAEKQESGLRLDRRKDALAGGDRGPLVVPKDSAMSLLIKVVTGHNDEELFMPPVDGALTKKQIELLRRWIDEGAIWPEENADISQ